MNGTGVSDARRPFGGELAAMGLDFLDITFRIEREFGISLSPEDFESMARDRDIQVDRQGGGLAVLARHRQAGLGADRQRIVDRLVEQGGDRGAGLALVGLGQPDLLAVADPQTLALFPHLQIVVRARLPVGGGRKAQGL